MDREKDTAFAKQGRTAALVIAGAMVIWIAANLLGGVLGIPGRYALLVDFAVLAALIWAMVNVYQMWRKRRASEG